MRGLHLETEPYDHGMLDVGDGNLVHWEVSGSPGGKPAVVLHGGPGSGSSPGFRRYFDPAAYRVVLFDQRGSGRSRPHASAPTTDLSVNTTEHLLADIELLRRYLDIDRWLVLGFSWGSTLGLAYAERHPRRVTELVLAGVTTTRRSEIDWLYRDVAPLFPEQWERFRAGAGAAAGHDVDLVEAYHRLLEDPDPAVRARAARDWSDWEWDLTSVDPEARPGPRWSQPDFQLGRARIVTHYFRHNAWLEDGVLLREAGALAGIPGVMVQGRLDLQSPLVTAWELARAWPDGELVLVGGAGHSTSDPGMGEALVAALDRFAPRR
jgi:proline iminopeptidase